MITIMEGDARDVARIMPTMESAFDPAYGESWTSAQCLSLLTLPASQLIIAQNDATIAGFAMSRWVLDEEELLMIGVHPDMQRQNIGSLLLEYIINKAKIQERTKLFLEVRSSNTALFFYRNKAFVSDGLRKHYYRGKDGASHDAITMTLNIK
jgi:[ribosomal protein S18]-alanine N-acetyltransferase